MRTRLRSLRTKSNLSLRDLGEKVGISFSTLGYIENGQRDMTLSHAIAIADFFHVSLDYLLYRTEDDLERFGISIEEAKKLSDDINKINKSGTLRKIVDMLLLLGEEDLQMVYNLISRFID